MSPAAGPHVATRLRNGRRPESVACDSVVITIRDESCDDEGFDDEGPDEEDSCESSSSTRHIDAEPIKSPGGASMTSTPLNRHGPDADLEHGDPEVEEAVLSRPVSSASLSPACQHERRRWTDGGGSSEEVRAMLSGPIYGKAPSRVRRRKLRRSTSERPKDEMTLSHEAKLRMQLLTGQKRPKLLLRRFIVQLRRDETGLNVNVLQRELGALLVQEVKPGPVQRWNRDNPDRAVQFNDRILSVNGRWDSAPALIERLKEDVPLEVMFGRNVEERYLNLQWMQRRQDRSFAYNVRVSRNGRLGLDVTMTEANCLRISSINKGPIQDWNESPKQAFPVKPGDVVVEVNDVMGSCKDLVDAISQSEDLRLTLVRGVGIEPCRKPSIQSTSPQVSCSEGEG